MSLNVVNKSKDPLSIVFVHPQELTEKYNEVDIAIISSVKGHDRKRILVPRGGTASIRDDEIKNHYVVVGKLNGDRECESLGLEPRGFKEIL